MKKKRAFILALALVLTLSACGKSESPDTNDQKTQGNNDSNISTPSNSTGSPTDDFLKTITAETAEAKGVCGPDLTWYYQDNVLVIKGTGEMTDYGGLSDEVCNPWHKYSGSELYKQIQWVIIDEGVTSIGDNAFYNCHALSKVVLPATLEQIGHSVFGRGSGNHCQIQEITIPASVTYIEDDPFCGNELNNVIFLGDAPEGAYQVVWAVVDDGTIYYSGTGFDELIAEYPDINWVKQ